MRNLRPGDLLFYKTHGRSWFLSRLIAKASHTAGEDSGRQNVCHVAMVGYGDSFADDWDLLEMTWPRARKTRLNLEKLEQHYDIECWRIKFSTFAHRGKALDWAYQHLGMKYDWKLLLFGLGDDKHKEVCSTFVWRAWNEGAKLNLYPNRRAERIVSPSELITSSSLERVW